MFAEFRSEMLKLPQKVEKLKKIEIMLLKTAEVRKQLKETERA